MLHSTTATVLQRKCVSSPAAIHDGNGRVNAGLFTLLPFHDTASCGRYVPCRLWVLGLGMITLPRTFVLCAAKLIK
jgi:hypothetical protein